MRFIVLILILCLYLPTSAQNTSQINADNVENLQSVIQVDFADFEATFQTGWFAMNDDGTRYLFSNGFGIVFDVTVNFEDSSFTFEQIELNSLDDPVPVSIVDAVYVDDEPYILYTLNGQAMLNDLELDMQNPIALFRGIENPDTLYVENSPVITGKTDVYTYSIQPLEPVAILPYAPADATDAVRIGRIPLPYVVTSTFEGDVTLWDVEAEQTLFEVNNDTNEPSVFGNINAPATHLVWRDNPNQNLYLLEFATGGNRYINDLAGQYAQWYFLSNSADTILAVNLEFQPIVVAWDVESGEQTTLGEHRNCERPQPDMSRLSADGTTLVIGCDTGLDIWRIVEENQS